jgi:hypothetical protein
VHRLRSREPRLEARPRSGYWQKDLRNAASPCAISLPEAASIGAIGFAAFTIAIAYLVDLVGAPVCPVIVFSLAALASTGAVYYARRGLRVKRFRIATALGWLVAVGGCLAYILWLDWPSLIPPQTLDVVHHLSLIDFIAARHSLVHGGVFVDYLLEFSAYTAGSHILAALLSDTLRRSAIFVVYPMLAGMVAIKVGFVYLIVIRLQKDQPSTWCALAAAALLLFTPDYTFGSFTHNFFFAQVVGETFALAMLWLIVVWIESHEPAALAGFSLLGVALWLIWPMWIAVPCAALLASFVLYPRSVGTTRQVLLTLAPIGVVAIAYISIHLRWLGIIAAHGAAQTPALTAGPIVFFGLAAIGLVANRRRPSVAAVAGFGAAVIAMGLACFTIDRLKHEVGLYEARKMLYLLPDPLAVLGGLGIGTAIDFLGNLRQGLRSSVAAAAFCAISSFALASGLDFHPHPPLNLPLYQVGMWTRGRVPNGCVEYLLVNKRTAYWLHIHVLGNPRREPRVDELWTHFEAGIPAAERWYRTKELPYAIVGDFDKLPPEVHQGVRVLKRYHGAAVVELPAAPACTDHTRPLYAIEPDRTRKCP